MTTYNILIGAGGTGGHLYPAIAVIQELEKFENCKINAYFIGNPKKIEARIIPKLGYKFFPIPIAGFYGIFSLKSYLLPFKIVVSTLKCRKIIREYKIDLVLCTGGYTSYPAGISANQENIPLVIMESNVFPGKTIKVLSKTATIIITAFEESKRYFAETLHHKIHCLGNPIRKDILEPIPKEEARKKFNLNPHIFTILAFGGSLGASSINKAMEVTIPKLANENIQFIWQTGKNKPLSQFNSPKLSILEYIDDMASAYAAADLIVCRAGASTIAEICALGKPSILVPYPHSANNEQEINAKVLEEANASIVINDAFLSQNLASIIDDLSQNPKQLQEMAENVRKLGKTKSTYEIAQKILELLEKR